MSTDGTHLEKELARLAAERTALFARSGNSFGLTPADQTRLRSVERELDECFISVRNARAARDAARFSRENAIVRRQVRVQQKDRPGAGA
jgi:hypothetical protein